MICAGNRKGNTGKVERRNENPNGDDYYLVRLDSGLTCIFPRRQLDDAQDMMDAIVATDTSTETSEHSDAGSEQSAAASESPRANAAAAAMVTINTEPAEQIEEVPEQTEEELLVGKLVVIVGDDTPTDVGDETQTVGQVVDYDEVKGYLVVYQSEAADEQEDSNYYLRERLIEYSYDEPASKRQRLADSA